MRAPAITEWSDRGVIHPAALLVAVLLHIGIGAAFLQLRHASGPLVTTLAVELSPEPAASPEPPETPKLDVPVPVPLAEVPPPPAIAPPEPEDAPAPAELQPPDPPPIMAKVPEAPLPPMPELPLSVPDTIPDPAPPPIVQMTMPAAARPLPTPPKHPVVPRPRPALTPAPTPPAAEPETSRVPTAVAASPPSPGQSANPSWQESLSAWLRAHRRYPEMARRHGDQGTVLVRFTVARDGAVTAVAVARSSGWDSLDEAALGMLRGTSVPAFPDTMTQASVTITIPIIYSLER